MTIAGFYLSPEGVVLGADSTSSAPCEIGLHYFDFNQKVFEVGENGTAGLVTWGLGGLGKTSYRTLLAELADDLVARIPSSLQDIAERWIDKLWPLYDQFDPVRRCRQLHGQSARTQDEEVEYGALRLGICVGFCFGGYVLPDRSPLVAHMTFDPISTNKPTPQVVTHEGCSWWGVPNIIQRLIFGADLNLHSSIMNSGKWTGTSEELNDVIRQQQLVHATLPIRDAVDYIHSCIYSTIKAMKFSNMPQVCGGPIEIAVITSDRRFRWVRHKPWDAAIADGGIP